MTVADFTQPALIIPRLRGSDAASVIQELSQALQRERRIPGLLPFYQSVLNREFMASTEVAAGMAFPHARLPGLKEVSFALGRSDKPLGWGAKAANGVRLVFLLAVPATDATQYLPLRSGIVRLAGDGRLMSELHAAQDAAQIFSVLQQIELRTSPPPAAAKPGRT